MYFHQRTTQKVSHVWVPGMNTQKKLVGLIILCLVFVCLILVSNASAQKNLRRIVITTQDGKKYSGKLLCVSDTLLVIWNSNKNLDWNNFNQNAIPLHVSEIERIVIKNKKGKHFMSGLRIGALIGESSGATLGLLFSHETKGVVRKICFPLLIGTYVAVPSALVGGILGVIFCFDNIYSIEGNGETYREILTELKKNAMFFSMIPTGQIVADTPPPDLEYNPLAIKRPASPWGSKLHISLAIGWAYTGAMKSVADAFDASGFGGNKMDSFTGEMINYPVGGDASNAIKLGLEYNLRNNFKVGIALSEIYQTIEGKDDELESLLGTSYDFFLEYIISRGKFLIKIPYEFSVGSGLGYNSLSVEGNLFSTESYHVKLGRHGFNKKNMIGGYLKSSLDFYLSSKYSVQFKIEGRWIPTLHVPTISQVSDYSNETKTLNEHTVNFSSIDVSFGLRLHL